MQILVDKSIKYFKDLVIEISNLKNIKFVYYDSHKITNKNIQEYDGLLVRAHTSVNKSLLFNSDIKFIGSASSGINHIDHDYLKKSDISFFNCSGSNSASVVNYVASAISILIKKKVIPTNFKLGIIGYGNIGKKLETFFQTRQISVIVYDPFLDHDHLVDFELIKNCDVVSLHVPLTKHGRYPTFNLINESFINEFEGKVIINTSRGNILNEELLLLNKNIKYICDTWSNEPEPSCKSIIKSFISTPHIAGHSFDGKLNATKDLILYLTNFLRIDVKESELVNIRDFKKNNTNKFKSFDEFIPSYNIEKESDDFKKLSKKFENKVSEIAFKKIRSKHPFRRDVIK